MIYETQTITHKQAKEFCRRFDMEIGTERELNTLDDEYDEYYVLCAELESQGEVNACRKFEESALRI